ncbi:DWNN-domain-containing protein [Phanerochaete sordida]|uniref:DWNN-domain-containing protein n=1 Tax=Phanerochaete sordida TaxID=48140 RepID=A0A9P3G8G0_9APHY|nr:DWNN-domain-containing protein [Phanerochaete sordida]
MASSVFYKFKSQRDESRVNFDGTGISVFDLKKEVILANNLGKANDFDLVVLDPSNNEEYKDDTQVIPRSSSVVVKRVFAKPGKGRAAMYIAGASTGSSTATPDPKASQGAGGSYNWHRGNISKRFDGREEPPSNTPKPAASAPVLKPSAITKDDEAAAMAAMFQAQTTNWEETQEKMSQAQRIYSNPRGGGPGRGGKPFQHHHIDRPLPPSYVCYRCGQKGHWIQDCPTNNDRDYDNRPRIKRTTGIPRSFLKAVENPSTGQIGHGIMVTPEGGYVVAQPDSASWQKQVQKSKGLSEAEVRERTPSDPSLVCPIDNKLFRDAVKTPCCGTLYCEECIQTYLLERDFVCPNCGNKIASLDKLVVDKPTRTRVYDYIDKEIEKSRNEGQAEAATRSSTPAAGSDKPAEGSGEQQQQEQDYYGDQQPGADFDMSQMIAASIPQLQAQIQQLNVMLSNSLPPDVRRQTEMKYQQLQMELQQAQMASAFIQASSGVGAGSAMPMQQMPQQYMQQQQQQQQQQWPTNPFSNQQPAGQDSAYQRLPLNNRRRTLKRERPSDFLEVAGENEAKVPRYWE